MVCTCNQFFACFCMHKVVNLARIVLAIMYLAKKKKKLLLPLAVYKCSLNYSCIYFVDYIAPNSFDKNKKYAGHWSFSVD